MQEVLYKDMEVGVVTGGVAHQTFMLETEI